MRCNGAPWTGLTSVRVQYHIGGAAIAMACVFFIGNMMGTSAQELRSRRDGDFVIGMLLPMRTVTTKDGQCSSVNLKSLFVLEALLYTIKVKRGKGMNGMRVGYDVRDTCFSVSNAMKEALNFIVNIEKWSIMHGSKTGVYSSNYSNPIGAITSKAWTSKFYSGPPLATTPGFPVSLPTLKSGGACQERPICGLIGPSGSSVSIAVAGLMSIYKIPMVSYFSTSAALSDNLTYPSFFRTIPSDNMQTIAMAQLIARFEWNYISTIATDNEYGREGIDALKMEIASRNICLARDELFDPSGGPKRVQDIIGALKSDTRVRVVILFMYWQHAKLFLEEAHRQNISGITWIASESWSSNSEVLLLPHSIALGIIGVSIPTFVYTDFQEHVQTRKLGRRARFNPWLAVYLRENSKFNCNLIDERGELCDIPGYNPALKNCSRDLTLGNLLTTNETLSVTVNAANALLTYTKAIELAIEEQREQLLKEKWLKHEDLVRYIRRVNFIGAARERVRFDPKGDIVGAKYHILNVQKRSDGTLTQVKVGDWKMTESPGQLTLDESRIQWNTGKKPDSICSSICGPGTHMIPSPSDCCWDCQKCQKGYISNTTQSLLCYRCDEFYHTDANQSECLPNEEQWVIHNVTLSVVVLLIATIGQLMIVCILIIIIVFRKLVVIRHTELKFTFLLVTAFGHVYPYLHLYEPRREVCLVKLFVFLIPFMFQSVILVCQTETVMFITGSILHKLLKTNKYKAYALFINAFAFGLLGVLLSLLVLTNRDPIVQREVKDEVLTFVSCIEPPVPGYASIFYGFVILLISAFLYERSKSGKSDNAYNGFSCYLVLLIESVCVPVYVTLRYEEPRIIVLTLCASILHITLTVLKFGPKLYDIFIKKDRATQEIIVTFDTDTSQTCHRASQPGGDCKLSPKKGPRNTNPDVDTVGTKMNPAPVKEQKFTEAIRTTGLRSGKNNGEENSAKDNENDKKPDQSLPVPEIICDHDETRKTTASLADTEGLDVIRISQESLHSHHSGEASPHTRLEIRFVPSSSLLAPLNRERSDTPKHQRNEEENVIFV